MSEDFKSWFRSEPYRIKYSVDHPAWLAAKEAWDEQDKRIVQLEQERDEAIDKKASALHAFDLCVQERDALQAENERLNKEMNESYAGQRFFNAGMERAAEIEVAKPDVGVAIGAAEWLAGFRCGVRAKADAIRKEIK